MKHAELVSDDLWEAIEPFLPKEPPKPKGGRPRVPDRAALAGIVFVLKTGIPWQMLPVELGCGSGSTCWRRLRDWQAAGVWEKLHTTLLNWLGDEAAIDWSRASVDSLSVRAKRGRADRPQPDRPRQARLQVPPGGGPERHPARGAHQPGELARLAHAGAAARRRASRQRTVGPSPQASRQVARR